MRILAISDEIVEALYTPAMYKQLSPIDMTLGCGDLPYSYMEYVVTHLETRHAYYVHGNHDAPEHQSNGLTLTQPGGWDNVDSRVLFIKPHKLIIAGMEGCIRYKPRAPHQYTQQEMALRIQRLVLQLLYNRARHGRYVDIFIAHSPPQGIHDEPKGAHRGFKAFLPLIQRFRPRLFLHGHNHNYTAKPWHTRYHHTEVVNICPFRVIDIKENNISYNRPIKTNLSNELLCKTETL